MTRPVIAWEKQSACATYRKRTRGSCLLRRPATGDGEVYHEGYSSVFTKQFQAYMPTFYCTFCCLGHCDFFKVHHCPVPWSWASPRCYDPSCVALVISSILDVDAYVHTMPKRVVCKETAGSPTAHDESCPCSRTLEIRTHQDQTAC